MTPVARRRAPIPGRDRPIEIVCHRGANQQAPENTLAAAARAIALGADLVEIDVRLSRDRELVVIHDRTLERTTDGRGRVADHDAATLDQLDAGSWFAPRFTGERLPRLVPFLEAVRGRAGLYVELKDAPPEDVVPLVRAKGMLADCFFWSFDLAFRERLPAAAPDIRVMARPQDVASLADARTRHGASIIEAPLTDLTADLVDACHALGLKLMVLCLDDDPQGFGAILRSGADMINLDHLERFLGVEAALPG